MQLSLSVSPMAIAVIQPTQGRGGVVGGDWTAYNLSGNGPIAQFVAARVTSPSASMLTTTKGVVSWIQDTGAAGARIKTFDINESNEKITFGGSELNMNSAASTRVFSHVMASGDIISVYQEGTGLRGQVLNVAGDVITGNADVALDSPNTVTDFRTELSPDGTEIAIAVNANNGLNLIIISQNGTTIAIEDTAQAITVGTRDDAHPSWQDDDNVYIAAETVNARAWTFSLDPSTRALTEENDVVTQVGGTRNNPAFIAIDANFILSASVLSNQGEFSISELNTGTALAGSLLTDTVGAYTRQVLSKVSATQILNQASIGSNNQQILNTLGIDTSTKTVTIDKQIQISDHNVNAINPTFLLNLDSDRTLYLCRDFRTERGFMQILKSINVDTGQSLVNEFTTNTKSVWGANANDDDIISDLLGTDKVVLGYSDTGDSSNGKVHIQTISGSVVTDNTPFTFNSANTEELDIVVNDASGVFAAFRDNGAGNSGRAIFLDVSGTTIDDNSGANAEEEFHSGNIRNVRATLIELDKLLVVFDDNVNTEREAVIITNSGGALTAGTPFAFDTGGTNGIPVPKRISNTEALVCWLNSSDSPEAIVLKIDGSTVDDDSGNNLPVALDAANTFAAAAGSRALQLEELETGKFAFGYPLGDLGDDRYGVAVITVTGTVPARGDRTAVFALSATHPSISVIDPGRIMVAGNSSGAGEAVICEVKEDTVWYTHRNAPFDGSPTTYTTQEFLGGDRIIFNFGNNALAGASQVVDLVENDD